MLNIVAHRGFWKSKSEQNTNIAFQRAFKSGFSVELDIRDYNNRLVIAHDPTSSKKYLYLAQIKLPLVTRKIVFFINLKSSELQSLISKSKIDKNNLPS